MIKALLIDDDRTHAEGLERALNRRGVTTRYAASIREAFRQLKCPAASIDLVVLVIADRSHPWLEILYRLQQASWRVGIRDSPHFLCVSRLSFAAEFQLQIERIGARYVTE
jgi:DNA-binding response OmpR family regulator